jgi:DNA-directed RNA polymerase specialized sigma24 family protein
MQHMTSTTSPVQRDVQFRLEALPRRQYVGLRAALAGFDDDEIATLLSIPVEAVRPTLRLAASKLVAALK